MRERREDGVGFRDGLVDDEARRAEVGVRFGDRDVVSVSAVQAGQLDPWVVQQQPNQLAACITGCADNSDRDRPAALPTAVRARSEGSNRARNACVGRSGERAGAAVGCRSGGRHRRMSIRFYE
jgi:hypothetical protein